MKNLLPSLIAEVSDFSSLSLQNWGYVLRVRQRADMTLRRARKDIEREGRERE